MERLLDCCKNICITEEEIPPLAEEITYKVVVKTGNTKSAGTDADVKIQLIGETGSTAPTGINKFLENDFERGQSDEYLVQMSDIGKPLLCKLGKRSFERCFESAN